jgi:2-amino-4-hydroxy-6-hydroxymethyldihydropteridine diphosphokinase
MGRPSKRPRNAPRNIDLDILYAGNRVLNNPEIIIPHPRLAQRRFVLLPLSEISPDLILPGQTMDVSSLLNKLQDPGIVSRIAERLDIHE